jgi:fructokinase
MNANQHVTLDQLAEKILAIPDDGARKLVAFVGAPASGKSTVTEALATALRDHGRAAQVVPMDGFHLDNAILDQRGLRSRKGAPETFDVDGFSAMVARLKAGGDVVYPLFDRSLDKAIAGAGLIGADTDIAILEGNYLLFDAPVWRELSAQWDVSVWLDTPLDVLRARLVQRWLDHDHTLEEAEARADGNDMANAARVAAHRLPADFVMAN